MYRRHAIFTRSSQQETTVHVFAAACIYSKWYDIVRCVCRRKNNIHVYCTAWPMPFPRRKRYYETFWPVWFCLNLLLKSICDNFHLFLLLWLHFLWKTFVWLLQMSTVYLNYIFPLPVFFFIIRDTYDSSYISSYSIYYVYGWISLTYIPVYVCMN